MTARSGCLERILNSCLSISFVDIFSGCAFAPGKRHFSAMAKIAVFSILAFVITVIAIC